MKVWLLCVLAVVGADDDWSLLKAFDFSSIDAVRADWDILQWPPGYVNGELEAYVDSPNNLYTRNKELIIRAQRNPSGCAYYANHDIKGQDYTSVRAVHPSLCCLTCRQNPTCKAFAYLQGVCYLKTGSENLTPASNGATVGICADITSARLSSKLLFSPVNVPGQKLRIEFTAKVPTAKGGWPALWVLGKEGPYGVWPQEGEIDVMEWVWQLQGKILSSLHWKGPTDWSTGFDITMQQLSNQYNTFGVEYSTVMGDEYIQYYLITAGGEKMMGELARPSLWESSWHLTAGPNQERCLNRAPGGSLCTPLAPFDNQMNLVLNFAVGGGWGGCCGVNGDYSAFDGVGVEFPIRSVMVYQPQQRPTLHPPTPNPSGAPENWVLLKAFDFSSMAAVRSEWVVETWPTAAFNNERQSYVDSPDTLFIDYKGALNLKAIQSFQCGSNMANTDISPGNNLKQVSGQAVSSCCDVCRQTKGCKAWTWSNFAGGTCWLKSLTSPVVSGANGVTANVMASVRSARIHSKVSFSPTLNATGRKIRVEAVAQVPTTPGAWPAIWLLGATPQYGNWPMEGEIDVMEWVWSIQNQIYSSLHWKSGDDYHTAFQLNMNSVAQSFITYGVEYSGQAGNEYIQYFIVPPSGRGSTMWGPRVAASTWASTWHPSPSCPSIRAGATRCSPLAPFDNPMMVILNVAVGGDWGGLYVGDYSAFNAGVAMKVQSIRVFHN